MAERYVVEPDLEFIKAVGALGGEDLKKCYQCATCSVACKISPDTKPFPAQRNDCRILGAERQTGGQRRYLAVPQLRRLQHPLPA